MDTSEQGGDDHAVKAVIEKAVGVTESERFLRQLCEQSFLKFWSYPCIFQNDALAKVGQGKELCDLLVVFGNDILIFSDKHCAFPDCTDINIAWTRWFKRAVLAGAKQVFGAERWIKSSPDRLFLDPKCIKPFPFPLPNASTAQIHRIVVAHGAAAACVKHFNGDSGSLIIDSTVKGDDHMSPSPVMKPFYVGQIDPTKGYVHVFDDVTLSIVMRTLDTVSDFVTYLSKKERFITTRGAVLATGEEELLAIYLTNLDASGAHDFTFPSELHAIFIDKGNWIEFQTNPQRLAQLAANKISYLWDELIEKFSHHIMAGTQYFTSSDGPSQSELPLRILAAENRTRRRMLAEGLLDVVRSANAEQRFTRVYQGLESGEPYYVFLSMPSTHAENEDQYRQVRRHLLEEYLLVCKRKFPAAEDIVGIAISPTSERSCSEDLMYLDARDWTPDLAAAAEAAQTELGLLGNVVEIRGKYREYPKASPSSRTGVPMKGGQRNAPCPCRSGRKFKKCCGRPGM